MSDSEKPKAAVKKAPAKKPAAKPAAKKAPVKKPAAKKAPAAKKPAVAKKAPAAAKPAAAPKKPAAALTSTDVQSELQVGVLLVHKDYPYGQQYTILPNGNVLAHGVVGIVERHELAFEENGELRICVSNEKGDITNNILPLVSAGLFAPLHDKKEPPTTLAGFKDELQLPPADATPVEPEPAKAPITEGGAEHLGPLGDDDDVPEMPDDEDKDGVRPQPLDVASSKKSGINMKRLIISAILILAMFIIARLLLMGILQFGGELMTPIVGALASIAVIAVAYYFFLKGKKGAPKKEKKIEPAVPASPINIPATRHGAEQEDVILGQEVGNTLAATAKDMLSQFGTPQLPADADVLIGTYEGDVTIGKHQRRFVGVGYFSGSLTIGDDALNESAPSGISPKTWLIIIIGVVFVVALLGAAVAQL